MIGQTIGEAIAAKVSGEVEGAPPERDLSFDAHEFTHEMPGAAIEGAALGDLLGDPGDTNDNSLDWVLLLQEANAEGLSFGQLLLRADAALLSAPNDEGLVNWEIYPAGLSNLSVAERFLVGQEAHRILTNIARNEENQPDWFADVSLVPFEQIRFVGRVDLGNRAWRWVWELKPNNASSITRGEWQLRDYVATQYAVSSALGQGIGVATGLQEKFSWAGVAAAGVGAAVAHGVGVRLPQGMNQTASRTLVSTASAIANAATRSLIDGSDFGDNILAAVPSENHLSSRFPPIAPV